MGAQDGNGKGGHRKIDCPMGAEAFFELTPTGPEGRKEVLKGAAQHKTPSHSECGRAAKKEDRTKDSGSTGRKTTTRERQMIAEGFLSTGDHRQRPTGVPEGGPPRPPRGSTGGSSQTSAGAKKTRS
ncbi:hypothetical protein NDU88_004186 [Pleurodeles waltl]|uniref:Uncharacterized protein n=1 Tax=Pleurodeles waltl TaxID=8319 RepID=A0AAV7UGF1_PLEWA|nr:hypothetical protein NDU88_004186 [Pleurodeles waltl]